MQAAHGDVVGALLDVTGQIFIGPHPIAVRIVHQRGDAQQLRFGFDGLVGVLTERAADLGECGITAGLMVFVQDLPAQECRAEVVRTFVLHPFDIGQGRLPRTAFEQHAGAREPHTQCVGVELHSVLIGRECRAVVALLAQHLAFAKPRFDIAGGEAQRIFD